MAAAKHREEHANTLVAHLLRGLDIDAQAETKGRKDRRHPDLIIRSDKMNILIEAKYDNRKGAQESADKWLPFNPPMAFFGTAAKTQVPTVIGALSYARAFEDDPVAAVKSMAMVEFAFKYANDGKGGWDRRWRNGTLYDLAESLHRPHLTTSYLECQIRESVSHIGETLDAFAHGFHGAPDAQEAVAAALRASLPVAKKEREVALQQSMRLAGLILFGAFSFHLALFNIGAGKVKSPLLLDGMPGGIARHWQYILDEFNCAAILRIAVTVMKAGVIPVSAAMKICHTAVHIGDIARDNADLMGAIYHEMFAELAKPLGVFYAAIPAATALSALALAPQKWNNDRTNPKMIKGFRAADSIRGSDALLAAACGQIGDKVMRAHYAKELSRAENK